MNDSDHLLDGLVSLTTAQFLELAEYAKIARSMDLQEIRCDLQAELLAQRNFLLASGKKKHIKHLLSVEETARIPWEKSEAFQRLVIDHWFYKFEGSVPNHLKGIYVLINPTIQEIARGFIQGTKWIEKWEMLEESLRNYPLDELPPTVFIAGKTFASLAEHAEEGKGLESLR